MIMLIKRNFLLYFRNRSGVILSFPGAMISFILYLVFLKANIKDSWSQVPHTNQLLDSLLISGTPAITGLTTTFSSFSQLAKDRESKVTQDLILTDLGRLGLSISYLLSTTFIGFLMLFLLVVAGCATNNSNTSSTQTKQGKLKISTTFYPIYDFTKNIVGDEADVSLMIGAGVEPHDYEPSAKEIAKMSEADALVYDSEYMETWIPTVLKTLSDSKVKPISATKDMVLLPGGEEEEHDHDHSEEGHSHEYDPHVWLSPERAIKMVQNITKQLVEAFPDRKEVFEKNANAYIEKLTALHNDYTNAFKDAKQKNFVTQHTAFRYLALDYNLNQVGITGISPEAEPSASRLAELTKYVKENDIKVIYFEENASEKIAKTLADETGVELAVLNPIESLTKEQMDKGEDYISVMRENLAALKKTTDQPGKDIQPEKTTDNKTVHNGYFEDSAVKDRTLSDYAGEWQSVYPYLVDGTLDQVFDYKAKLKKTMTKEEFKDYYTKGYKSDITNINITDKTMEFKKEDGTTVKAEYKYVGYKILTYKKGFKVF